MATIYQRREEAGGNCAVDGYPVFLYVEDRSDPESWYIVCEGCTVSKVPQWCIIDSYSRRQWLKRNWQILFDTDSLTATEE